MHLPCPAGHGYPCEMVTLQYKIIVEADAMECHMREEVEEREHCMREEVEEREHDMRSGRGRLIGEMSSFFVRCYALVNEA